MLLKRFREQVLHGRFATIDFETEILNRMKTLSNVENASLLGLWKDQLKYGRLIHKDFYGTLLMRMSGFEINLTKRELEIIKDALYHEYKTHEFFSTFNPVVKSKEKAIRKIMEKIEKIINEGEKNEE